MDESVKQKAAKGMLWSLIQRFSSVAIQFISGIILARLLTPSDYGVIGMLLIFMVVAQALMDGGFGSALIQRKNPTQEDYSTIFWWNMGMSLVLYGVMYAISPWVADFYHMPILCKVLRVQSLVLIINALSLVQANQLSKQFRFKKIMFVNMTSSVISLFVTIYLAYHGYGVWSLVFQNLLMAFIPMTIYWCTNKWFPSFVFSKESFRSLFSFGFFIFLTHLINEVCNNIQGLLIGRFFNASMMGYYSKARSTEKLAASSISQALQQVTFPLYSALQDDKKTLVDTVRRLTQYVAFLVFPLMFCLILVAKPAFVLIYSERWIPSVPYFQAFCLLGLSGCLQSINTQTIAAIGKSKQMFGWTIVKRSVGIVMIVLGLVFWGIWGLVWASVIHNWLVYIVNVSLISKYIKCSFSSQIYCLIPVLAIAVVSFSVTYLMCRHIDMNMYLKGGLQILCYVAIYLGLAYLFKLSSFQFYKGKLINFLSRGKKCFMS